MSSLAAFGSLRGQCSLAGAFGDSAALGEGGLREGRASGTVHDLSELSTPGTVLLRGGFIFVKI